MRPTDPFRPGGRAFRRPVTSQIPIAARSYKDARRNRSFDFGIQMGLRAAGESGFLFRAGDPALSAGAAIESLTRAASRLSFFSGADSGR